jgi:hypothetical protein
MGENMTSQNNTNSLTYDEFVFRAGMMAFDGFPNLTSCLEWIATNDREPANVRNLALQALKKEKYIL